MARPLVVLLPGDEIAPNRAPQIQIRLRYEQLVASPPSPYWIICGVLAAVMVFSAIAHHGFQLDFGGP